MPTISEALSIALLHHQAGRLLAAEQIYRKILQAEPAHAEATHLLGMIAHQRGRHEIAVEYVRRAIGLRGNDARFHYNLAKVYDALRQPSEAVACYRRALELEPNLAEAHHNLGVALKEQGKLEETIACYRRALELEPNLAEAYDNLGNALTEQGRPAEALACCRRALELKPDLAEAHHNLGAAFKDQGKLEEAIASYRRALTLKPSLAAAHHSLGNALRALGKLEEAVACYHRALAIQPTFADAHNNLGKVLIEQAHLEEAAACCRRALELRPNFAGAYNNLGNVFIEQGNPVEAIACFRRTLALEPDSAEVHANLAFALLQLGHYEEGWTEYESRLALLPPRAFSAPRWNREAAEGQTILLHCEQGFGDTLQFLRYAGLVRERTRAGRVILESPPEAARLLALSDGGAMEIVVRGNEDAAALPQYDWHLPLLSSPLALELFTPWPMSSPYLRADPALRAVWRERLGRPDGCRVGLVWEGARQHPLLRHRSIEGEKLLPLLRQPGFRFYNLTVNADAAGTQPLVAAGLIDLSGSIGDFADTAAVMAELDLIISVDTASAHLAGALGRPVWTLLRFVSDWRWGLKTEATPWYPTMRLFRQPKSGDWDSVLRRIGEELNRPDLPQCVPA